MQITSSTEFGEAIRRRRKELHYTQTFVSEVTGFSTSFISELENGKETAELGKAIYLANMLGLNIDMTGRK